MSLATAVVLLIYAVAVAVILALPASWLGEETARGPWWSRARFWATLVALLQMAIYVVLG